MYDERWLTQKKKERATRGRKERIMSKRKKQTTTQKQMRERDGKETVRQEKAIQSTPQPTTNRNTNQHQ